MSKSCIWFSLPCLFGNIAVPKNIYKGRFYARIWFKADTWLSSAVFIGTDLLEMSFDFSPFFFLSYFLWFEFLSVSWTQAKKFNKVMPDVNTLDFSPLLPCCIYYGAILAKPLLYSHHTMILPWAKKHLPISDPILSIL